MVAAHLELKTPKAVTQSPKTSLYLVSNAHSAVLLHDTERVSHVAFGQHDLTSARQRTFAVKCCYRAPCCFCLLYGSQCSLCPI